MKLFDVKGSPNCLKVRVIARELGLPLEIVPVDLASAKDQEYLALNPAGKVPTLVDDNGFVLWESGAILLYLAAKSPKSQLLPSHAEERANVERWIFFAANHLQPWLSLLGQERVVKPRQGKPSDLAIIALAERELARFLPILNDALSGRDYLADVFSVADIALGCGLENCEARGVALGNYPHVVAWRERLRARAAWRD